MDAATFVSKTTKVHFAVSIVEVSLADKWTSTNYNSVFCSLFVYCPSCLGQNTAKCPLRSSSQAANFTGFTCWIASNF